MSRRLDLAPAGFVSLPPNLCLSCGELEELRRAWEAHVFEQDEPQDGERVVLHLRRRAVTVTYRSLRKEVPSPL